MFIESYFDDKGFLVSHDTLIELWYVLSYNMPSLSFTALFMLYHTSVIRRFLHPIAFHDAGFKTPDNRIPY